MVVMLCRLASPLSEVEDERNSSNPLEAPRKVQDATAWSVLNSLLTMV